MGWWTWLRAPERATARYVVLVFVATRLALLLLALVGSKAIGPAPGQRPVARFPERPVLSVVHRWDAGWYERVALHGYDALPADRDSKQRPEAFFPAFPLLARAAGEALGGGPEGVVTAGVLLSNLAFLGALFFLHGLARRYLGEDGARRAVLLAAVFPGSLFCSVFYAEGLYLFAVTGALYAYERDRLAAAGLCGALGALTRPTGLLLFPALLVGALHRRRWRLGAAGPRLLWLLLIPAGLAAFALSLAHEKGDALLFLRAQAGWHRGATFPLWTLFQEAAQVQWDLPVRSPSQLWLVLELLTALGLCGAAAYLLRRFDAAHALFLGFSLLAPLASGQVTSLPRFALTLAPLFLVLAAVTARPLVERFVLYASTLLLGVHALLWGTGSWAG